MPEFMPKLPLAQALLMQSAIFFAGVPILSAMLSFARALARFGSQQFVKSACFGTTVLCHHHPAISMINEKSTSRTNIRNI